MNNPDLFNENHQATYCPEDDKLRLYVGRVPREEYEALRKEGWTSTPKQDCDFVAVWTSRREDTALSYAGVILDEDQGPEDRAADRAERFGDYRDKRLGEATGHADRYDSGPSVHGYQSEARAERSAARHDRIGGRAVNAWDKAEYWTHRTAGVISHALHNSSPGVRMGRIKTIEKELRDLQRAEAAYRSRYKTCTAILAESDPAKAHRRAYDFANQVSQGSHYHHPREESRTKWDRENGASLYSLMTQENDPISGHEAATLWFVGQIDPESEAWKATRTARALRHCELRLAYEMQMLGDQGGRAELLEMEVGGTFGGKLIMKVNRSGVTKRIVSVSLKVARVQGWTYKVENVPGTDYALALVETERFSTEAYKAPTPESLAELEALTKAKKEAAKAKKKAGDGPAPLVNPTPEDAERLQEIWNDAAAEKHPESERSTVRTMTQAEYSARSGSTYASCGTKEISENLTYKGRKAVFKIRVSNASGNDYGKADRVIVITDKPQKKIPWAEVERVKETMPTPERLAPRVVELTKIVYAHSSPRNGTPEGDLFADAVYCGLAWSQSQSQFGYTTKGEAWRKEVMADMPVKAEA